VSILIVEDDAFSFEVLSSMLEAIAGSSEQYALPPLYLEVSRAASGEEAWDLIEARPRDFDLAFVDIQLPGITGMS
jgi:CheY-like chemotaxis protein|tara:strand:+ start:11069 stop:11296 length:228 start_codon:yes stop_codon:yes gene_type:complete